MHNEYIMDMVATASSADAIGEQPCSNGHITAVAGVQEDVFESDERFDALVMAR